MDRKIFCVRNVISIQWKNACVTRSSTMFKSEARSATLHSRHKASSLSFIFVLLFTAISILSHTSADSTVTSLSIQNALLLARVRAYWECEIGIYEQAYAEELILENTCSMVFDGWLCWQSTKIGTVASASCDQYYENATNVRSSRSCMANATWEDPLDNGGNHPCAPNDEKLIPDDESFWNVIKATNSLGPELFPYINDATTREYEACVFSTLYKPHLEGDIRYCPRTFDGWSCWNDTPAGQIAQVRCPVRIGFDARRKAHKVCTVNGTWFTHPDNGKVWSNYTTCVDKDDLDFRSKINNLYITGYSISVTALTISLMVFFVFKSLKCGRVTIHKNLFFSFIVNNTLWIVWYTAVVLHPTIIHENHIPCQILHVLLHYFLVSNYFWMFCEGFYLHTLLVVAFVAEIKIMRWLYVLGWGAPLLLTIIYTSVRINSEDATHMCWIDEHYSMWILNGPVCLSMFLNFSFLINIVRVLVTKLRAVNSPDSNHTRKAVRATLILIPLLGLHYVIVPFRPEPGSPGERVYEATTAIVTSFQGFCVALLFCFFNGEVIALVRKRWKQEIMMRQKDRRTSYAATTISWDEQDTSL